MTDRCGSVITIPGETQLIDRRCCLPKWHRDEHETFMFVAEATPTDGGEVTDSRAVLRWRA